MSPFKSPFKFRWAKKETTQPDGAKDQTLSGNVSNGTPRGEPKRTHPSMYPEGDFRRYSEEYIEGMRGNMMLEHLHNEQSRRLWYTWGPSQGVVLNQGRGKYAACPPQLQAESSGLFDQIVMMNIRCAMTINTHTIQLFLSVQQHDHASIRNGLAIQILPSVQYLPRCFKHQFAAFIRNQGCLVVWDDEPEHLVTRVAELESSIVATIWNGDEMEEEEKRENVPVDVTKECPS